ncbi:rootletin-like isoform X2 [Hydractinia symbiolongicarpus]|uniref:rootletin-like isoform X2 n=1 Tax=Hydractinia symbiolongicarpus TaxID=13093 RepID=UPI00254BBB83|nr:rootletin-like isoform X2 [Hydractinia symbiolongicarpus]
MDVEVAEGKVTKENREPVLLRLPFLKKKENQYVPQLIKVPLLNSKAQAAKQSQLIHLPLKQRNLVIQNVHEKIMPPKLIDLRSVLNLHNKDNNLRTKPSYTDTFLAPKNPTLVKLPSVLHEPVLLDSPKRTVLQSPKKMPPSEPILVDIRLHTPQQPTKLISTIEQPRLIKTPDLPNFSDPPVILKDARRKNEHKQQHVDDSQDSDSEYKGKRRRSRDDELYDVITELLLQKKKRKKKRRRLKIFDIIDNIPLTSDSDSDVEPLRKHSKERNNILELPNLGLTFLPPYTNKKSVKETSKITSTTQQTFSSLPEPPRDLYKPKVPRFLDPNNKKDDPLSWENIIKDVRRETRETQTEKTQKENNLVTQEIQTEISDMIDIPRTQTFFTEQRDHVSDKTKEFCDRVRNEVLQKLDHLQSLEEKSCQTISHASVQTDEIKNDKGKTDSSVQQQNVRFKEESYPSLTPDIYSQLQFTDDTQDGKKNFIDVMDLDQNQTSAKDYEEPYKNNNEIDTDFTVDFKNEFKNNIGKDLPSNSKTIQDEVVTTSKTVPVSTKSLLSTGASQSTKLKQNSIEHKGNDRHSQQKDRHLNSTLQNNMDEFSYGLKALEDLHENLELELKQSKFLFNTIMTLQDGFAPDDQKNISAEGSEELLQGDQFDVKINARDKEREDAHSTENDQQARPCLDLNVNPNDVNLKQENDELKFDNVIGKPDFQSSVEFESMPDKKDGDNDEMAPRYEVQSRLNSAFSPRSDIFSPRSAYSELRNTSSVRFSADLLNENEKEEIENEEEMKQRKEKEEAMKKEIRKRILKDTDDKENESKVDEKRTKLLAWMKNKHKERSQTYKQMVDERRGAEHRPFLSKRQVTKREIDQNTTIQDDLKRAMLEENNEERVRMAQKLVDEVMSKKKKMKTKSPFRRKFKNERYKNSTTSIPVRETRASRIRRTALISDVLNTTKLRQETSRRKLKSKTKERRKESVGSNFADVVFPNQSMDCRSTAGRSSRMSVEAHEFVTKVTYDRYQDKLTKRLRQTVKQYDSPDYIDYVTNDGRRTQNSLNVNEARNSSLSKFSYKSALDTRPKRYDANSIDIHIGLNANQSSASLQSSVDNTEVKNILQKYGLHVDEGLFGGKSETSNLLAEVEFALLDENSEASPTTLDTIDWNEVDKILNE